MRRARRDGLFFLLFGGVLFLLIGFPTGYKGAGWMGDFKILYYGSRCLLQHRDPYNGSELLHVYLSEVGEDSSDPMQHGQRISLTEGGVYLPTAPALLAPLAMLPWGVAHTLWLILSAASILIAALLAWQLGADAAPVLSGVLIGFLLFNSVSLLMNGNVAGIIVSLCIVAVWSFFKNRFVIAGVLCLAVALAFKPHDAGPVWLYFLLAGGVYRKRALQALTATVLLALPAILWVAQVSPHWMQEMNSNLSVMAANGSISDPGPNAPVTAGMVIDLQSVVSVFRDDPRIYNPISYVVCGALLLVWSLATLKARFSPTRTWLALAAIAAISMLPVYHRPYDARLLLLAVPACAMLWKEGRPVRWLALAVTAGGIVFTGDFPLGILVVLTRNLHFGNAGMLAKVLTVVLRRPPALVLLVMGIFYLVVYVSRSFTDTPSPAAAGPLSASAIPETVSVP
jgi:hypothetical protein